MRQGFFDRSHHSSSRRKPEPVTFAQRTETQSRWQTRRFPQLALRHWLRRCSLRQSCLRNLFIALRLRLQDRKREEGGAKRERHGWREYSAMTRKTSVSRAADADGNQGTQA